VFNDDWMREKGFLETEKHEALTIRQVIAKKKDIPLIISVKPEQSLQDTWDFMRHWQISQVPVIDADAVAGQIDEVTILRILHDHGALAGHRVQDAMGLPPPCVTQDTPVREAYRLLLSGHQGIVVTEKDAPLAYLTRSDLVELWAQS
jgi:cystathionine beta-synthase